MRRGWLDRVTPVSDPAINWQKATMRLTHINRHVALSIAELTQFIISQQSAANEISLVKHQMRRAFQKLIWANDCYNEYATQNWLIDLSLPTYCSFHMLLVHFNQQILTLCQLQHRTADIRINFTCLTKWDCGVPHDPSKNAILPNIVWRTDNRQNHPVPNVFTRTTRGGPNL